MKPLRLPARLAAAADLVRPGSRAADIGCDHGLLAAFLAESGRCPFVVAADLRPAPLAKARALAAQRGLLGRVDCRLGDGLSVLAPGEVQDIVIAGMGGETIGQLLAAAPQVLAAGPRLVLLPASRPGQLRRFLAENGFSLQREDPVAEGRHCYTVMQAVYTGVQVAPGPLFCLLGLLQGQRSPAAALYFAGASRQLAARAEGLRAAGRPVPPELAALRQAVEREVEGCQEER